MNKENNEVSERGFNVGLFFIAISMGIFGNLIANILDRHYSYLGTPYELCIVAVFLVTLWYLDKCFTKIILGK